MTPTKDQFFVQYWGQKVLRLAGEPLTGWNHYYVYGESVEVWKTQYLELASLSNISDEDCIAVAKIMGYKKCKYIVRQPENIFIEEFKTKSGEEITIDLKSCSIEWNNGVGYDGYENSGAELNVYQYLQSKGYALPYMNYSVEDLIEKGWIKIKTHSK